MSDHLQNSHTQSPVFSDAEIDHGISALQEAGSSEYRALSMMELVGVFPEAKSVIKQLIKEDEEIVNKTAELKQEIGNRMFRKLPLELVDITTELALALVRKDFIEHKGKSKYFKTGEWAEDRLARNRKLLALFNNKGGNDDFQTKLKRARLFPIENLIKVDRAGFAKCPFHEEKTGSFQINRKKNVWFCFAGCGGGDVIEFYMRLNGVGFKEAVGKMS